MKILLVEDHVSVADSTVMLLRLLGHEVRHAKTGQEAISAATDSAPDVMLVDIGLPDMTGHDVARKLRSMPEFDRKVILIALTGYDCAEKAKQSGFDHYYKKPMDLDILPNLVN